MQSEREAHVHPERVHEAVVGGCSSLGVLRKVLLTTACEACFRRWSAFAQHSAHDSGAEGKSRTGQGLCDMDVANLGTERLKAADQELHEVGDTVGRLVLPSSTVLIRS